MTKRCVVDCSFAAALFLPDQSSSRVQAFFLEPPAEMWMPALWWYELGNVLTVAQRRRILTRADAEKAISLYGQFHFKTDIVENMEHVHRLSEIAREYALSVYDASYLELAMRLGASIATLDQQILKAAAKSGVQLWT